MLALLFAVGYAAFLVYRPPTDRPVWLGLVALLMVPLLLVLWQSGIAWVRVLPRGPRDSPLVRKWTWIADLTSAVFFLVCLMSVALPLWYAGRLLRIARGLPPREAIAVLERVDAWFQFMTWGPLAVIVVGVGFMVFAYLKLRKARKADEAAAEESQGGERGRG
jgi:heme/copper-type cytochrome/quinol oxidase subunit 2